MSVRLLPGEEHLGYAPERESWDTRFPSTASWSERSDERDEVAA